MVRLYLQLSDEDAKEVINAKGRIDRTKWGPEKLLEIAKRSLRPFTISFPDKIEWWTLYISEWMISFNNNVLSNFTIPVGQRVASSFLVKGTSIHSW